MACVKPITIHKNKQSFKVPCGHCMNCRVKKMSQLEFLANKELLYAYSRGLGCSFVTLTYTDENLPRTNKGTPTLRRKDLQNFHKRVRQLTDIPYKHISCLEYGDSLGRPHMHIIFVGLSDVVAYNVCKKAWKFGLYDVGPLTQGGLRYVVKYCCKADSDDVVQAIRDGNAMEQPKIMHSIGLGKRWIESHINDIVESNFLFYKNGRSTPYPKYVLEYVKDKTGVDYRPIIQKFYNEDTIQKSKVVDKLAQDYLLEQNILRERMLMESARSRGIVVTPEYISSRHWIKPRTKSNLSDILDECK